jgi:hypothetical protein
VPSGVFWEEIAERSIKNTKSSTTTTSSGAVTEPKEVMMIEETWMQPYIAYMINKKLPEDAVEAKRITRRAEAFVVIEGKLYKRSITGVLQRCVTPQEGQTILKDIHGGCRSGHGRLGRGHATLPHGVNLPGERQ